MNRSNELLGEKLSFSYLLPRKEIYQNDDFGALVKLQNSMCILWFNYVFGSNIRVIRKVKKKLSLENKFKAKVQ